MIWRDAYLLLTFGGGEEVRSGKWKKKNTKLEKPLRVYLFIKDASKIERKKKVKLSRVHHRTIVITCSQLLWKRGSSLTFSK